MLLPIGMIVVGWLDGVIGRRPSVLLSYALSLVGIGLLWLLGRFPSAWLLGAFVVCFGGMLGSRGPLVSTIALGIFRGRQRRSPARSSRWRHAGDRRPGRRAPRRCRCQP